MYNDFSTRAFTDVAQGLDPVLDDSRRNPAPPGVEQGDRL
jgi:hypothetical protein